MPQKSNSSTEDILFQWTKTWSEKDLEQLIKNCETDMVGLPFFLKYLPKNEITLECGCGFGQWVIYLSHLGYKMAGVEIVPDCIKICKTFFPQADVRVGDVRKLPFEDDYFGGYISIGVFEHMIEGPSSTIQEMRRVLKPGGIAIITVPAFNYFMRMWYPLRGFLVELFRMNSMMRKILGKPAYSGNEKGFDSKLKEIKSQVCPEFWPTIGVDPVKGPLFIEYKCSKESIEKILRSCSFEILESVPVFHPYIFHDIFGEVFFKKGYDLSKSESLELNFFGRALRSLFDAISPLFFNYVNLYVIRAEK